MEGDEVICVDDASKDGSLAILNEYAARYENVHVIVFDKNKGMSAARNAGLANAKGTYVMFCDPDDAYVPNALEYIYTVASKYSPEVIFFKHKRVCSQSESIQIDPDAAVRFYDMTQARSAVDGFKVLFASLWTWNGAFHRNIYTNQKFDERLWPSEDVLWGVASVCRCRSALVSNAVLYKYLYRQGSCLNRVFLSRVKSEIIGIGEFFKEARDWKFYDQVRFSVFSRLSIRAYVRPMSIIPQLTDQEQKEAWDLLFHIYYQVWKTKGLVPWPLRPFYVLPLKLRWKFAAKNITIMPFITLNFKRV